MIYVSPYFDLYPTHFIRKENLEFGAPLYSYLILITHDLGLFRK